MSEKIALVTGAARGQGAALVRRFAGRRVRSRRRRPADRRSAQPDRGARRRPRGDRRRVGRHLRGALGDAVAETVERFGGLSTLVNNAGVLHRASLSEETAEGFEKQLAVQHFGPVPRASGRSFPISAQPRVRQSSTRAVPARSGPFPSRGIRIVEMGVAWPDPDRGSRARR